MEKNNPDNKISTDEQSWLYKIVILPKYLGEAIFNLSGKTEARPHRIKMTTTFLICFIIDRPRGFDDRNFVKLFLFNSI